MEHIMSDNEKEVNKDNNPYILVSKKMLWDKSISPKAKGFLVQCLFLEGPHTSIDKISKQINVSRHSSYTICKELQEAGYLIATHRLISKGIRKNAKQPIYVFFDHHPTQQEVDIELAEVNRLLSLVEVE
jgi:hypothetical protein